MPLGFFDSGVGGLSVMREAIKIMPNENYIYFGDSKNAPYGTKSVKEVRDLTFKAVEYLLSRGVKGIAIACNTATSAAVAELRRVYPELPLVGIEPAIKPAVELNIDGDILVMATPMTLAENKFSNLVIKYKDRAKIIPVPCAGLAELIERGSLEGFEMKTYLSNRLKEYDLSRVSTIVLGCTHYPFIQNELRNIVGNNVNILDGGYGTAKELKRRLDEKCLLNSSEFKGNVEIINSANEERLVNLSYKLLEIR